MTELKIGELLLDLALLFVLTYLLAAILERRRIPGILAALFIAMAVHYTPPGVRLLSPVFSTISVPLLFALLMDRWGKELRSPQRELQPKEHSHA